MSQENIDLVLNSIDDRAFEHFVSDLFESYGWSTRVTQQSGDKGVDVIARQNEPVDLKLLIQAKKYSKSNKVTRAEVQQYAGLYTHEENVSSVIIVSTSTFGRSAVQVADEADVELIDRSDLVDLIQDTDQSFLTKYTEKNIESSQPSDDSDLHSPGLESNIEIKAVDPEVPVVVSLLGVTEIDVNLISTEFSTDRRYRTCVFLEIHNQTNKQWTTTPKAVSIIDSSGYIHDPDWIKINSDSFPAKWGIGRWVLEPGDRIRTLMIFPEFDANKQFSELRYERSIYKATRGGSESTNKHSYSKIKQSICPTKSQLSELQDVSFTLSTGETITK